MASDITAINRAVFILTAPGWAGRRKIIDSAWDVRPTIGLVTVSGPGSKTGLRRLPAIVDRASANSPTRSSDGGSGGDGFTAGSFGEAGWRGA
jgi:hypothetical protein